MIPARSSRRPTPSRCGRTGTGQQERAASTWHHARPVRQAPDRQGDLHLPGGHGQRPAGVPRVRRWTAGRGLHGGGSQCITPSPSGATSTSGPSTNGGNVVLTIQQAPMTFRCEGCIIRPAGASRFFRPQRRGGANAEGDPSQGRPGRPRPDTVAITRVSLIARLPAATVWVSLVRLRSRTSEFQLGSPEARSPVFADSSSPSVQRDAEIGARLDQLSVPGPDRRHSGLRPFCEPNFNGNAEALARLVERLVNACAAAVNHDDITAQRAMSRCNMTIASSSHAHARSPATTIRMSRQYKRRNDRASGCDGHAREDARDSRSGVQQCMG